MTDLCFYCQETDPIPGERFCSKCHKELSTNRANYLKRLIADARDNKANFEALSKGAGKYRISKGNAVGDEYATKRFGELVQVMQDRINSLSEELQEGQE